MRKRREVIIKVRDEFGFDYISGTANLPAVPVSVFDFEHVEDAFDAKERLAEELAKVCTGVLVKVELAFARRKRGESETRAFFHLHVEAACTGFDSVARVIEIVRTFDVDGDAHEDTANRGWAWYLGKGLVGSKAKPDDVGKVCRILDGWCTARRRPKFYAMKGIYDGRVGAPLCSMAGVLRGR